MVSSRMSYPHTTVRARASNSRGTLGRLETALLIIAVCILVVLAVMSVKNLTISHEPVMRLEVEVGPGDTLWSIAQEYGDPNEYILARMDRLARANDLKRGEALREGQTLVIPISSRCAELYCGGTYASRKIAD